MRLDDLKGASWVHATAIAIDGRGVLIEGPSGSGKSRLACDLLFHASEAGRDAALVGDDRVHLRREGMSILAKGHPAIAGQLEIRGRGLMPMRTIPEAPIAWIVRISGDQDRLPEPRPASSQLLELPVETYWISNGNVAATSLLGSMLRTAAFMPLP
jgi:HPr kinase/phosphorylase